MNRGTALRMNTPIYYERREATLIREEIDDRAHV